MYTMDVEGFGNQKCFTTKAGGSLMVKLLSVILSMMFIGSMLYNPVLAQNPCAEIGSDCRVLTATEVKAFKELVLAVNALLPVPDAARYQPDGAIEASTMPFVAETKISSGVMTGGSWPAGCFPISPNNTLHFGYDAKSTQEKPAGKAKDPLAAVQAMMAVMENKIELVVWLRPHPYLVNVEDGKIMDVRDQDAYNIEKSAEFLSWQTGDDNVTLNMIFGPRTVKEAETLNTDKPSPKFAPLKSIELIISGPKDEVAALKKKIDRHAFAALLGPVVK
jgi:hypothetical protein